jgi:hypothetical protein
MKRNDKLALVFFALILALVVAFMLYGNASGNNDKITICHATGSASNPYVEITIDSNALPAHIKHGDIYPVPANGCPTAQIPTVFTTAHPPATPTNPAKTGWATAIFPTKAVTQEPPVIVEQVVNTCSVCCVTQGEVKAIYSDFSQFIVGLNDVTRIEVKNCCAYVYKGDKLTHQVNLAGWVVELK